MTFEHFRFHVFLNDFHQLRISKSYRILSLDVLDDVKQCIGMFSIDIRAIRAVINKYLMT